MKKIKKYLGIFILYISFIGIVIMCAYGIGYNHGIERAIPVLEDCLNVTTRCVNLL